MFSSQMKNLMPITYLPPTSHLQSYNLHTYLPTHPPIIYLHNYLPYLPTHPPTHLPRCTSYLSIHPPITYLHINYPFTYPHIYLCSWNFMESHKSSIMMSFIKSSFDTSLFHHEFIHLDFIHQ